MAVTRSSEAAHLDTCLGFTYDARRMSAATELLRTPLYDLHVAAGARMIPFGGWEMPVQYRSIIAEHQAVRDAAGLFDLSHMGRLFFRGPGGAELLQWISTNNVGALAPGRAQYNLLCNEAGGILDDTVAYRLEPDEYLLVVNASNRVKILKWIEHWRSTGRAADVEDGTLQTVMIGLQGPLAEELLAPLADVDLRPLRYYAATRCVVAGYPALVSRTGYTGEDGFELIVSAADGPSLWKLLADQRAPVQPMLCGLGARDTLRLEAGMPLYGHELNESINPYEANLQRVVKLDKGEFVGRSALLEISTHPLTRRLVGFQMVDNAVPRQDYVIVAEDRVIGRVTSGSYSPSLRRNIGMAYVAAEFAAPGREIAVIVRERPQRAVVVDLPHYPHRTRRRTGSAGG